MSGPGYNITVSKCKLMWEPYLIPWWQEGASSLNVHLCAHLQYTKGVIEKIAGIKKKEVPQKQATQSAG